mmetsp:Transcript_40066/g.78773  ORF Transcript_40066/g.78773 Transcript_40066/m.78773 type:complete len:214 (+) Transcript_40066:1110-1751(+)
MRLVEVFARRRQLGFVPLQLKTLAVVLWQLRDVESPLLDAGDGGAVDLLLRREEVHVGGPDARVVAGVHLGRSQERRPRCNDGVALFVGQQMREIEGTRTITQHLHAVPICVLGLSCTPPRFWCRRCHTLCFLLPLRNLLLQLADLLPESSRLLLRLYPGSLLGAEFLPALRQKGLRLFNQIQDLCCRRGASRSNTQKQEEFQHFRQTTPSIK